MRSTAALVMAALILLAPDRARASEEDAPGAPVSEDVASALGIVGTFVPFVAGGLTFAGLATGADTLSIMASGAALVGFGLALGPGLAHGYIGRRGYAAASTIVRMGLAVGMTVSTQFFFAAIVAMPITCGVLLAWAIVDLALIPRMVERANGTLITLAPWSNENGGAGLAVLGRF